jgi:hypothetical protein
MIRGMHEQLIHVPTIWPIPGLCGDRKRCACVLSHVTNTLKFRIMTNICMYMYVYCLIGLWESVYTHIHIRMNWLCHS